MIGEITKILPYEKSRNGNSYMRIFFKMENGDFMKTDICPDYRNYKRWRKVARLGNRLFNLEMKDHWTVDADSRCLLLEGRRVIKDTNLEEMAKQGVFG